MKVAIVGAPGAGKTTLAQGLASALKSDGYGAVYCPEYAREYITRYGALESPFEQLLIFHCQRDMEDLACQHHDIVVCDTSTWLCTLYARLLAGLFTTSRVLALLDYLDQAAWRHLETYDLTILLPHQSVFQKDVARVYDPALHVQIQEMIEAYLHLEDVSYYVVTGGYKERLDTAYQLTVEAFLGLGKVLSQEGCADAVRG